MIRPLGPRVLVRPVVTPPDPSKLIQELHDAPTVQGDVIAVGMEYCQACTQRRPLPVLPGARVLLRPWAIIEEIVEDGETLWMVPWVEVLGELEPMEASVAVRPGDDLWLGIQGTVIIVDSTSPLRMHRECAECRVIYPKDGGTVSHAATCPMEASA